MVDTQSLIRRRRGRAAGSLSVGARFGMVLLTVVGVTVGLIASGLAVIYLDVARSVPAVEDVSAFFEPDTGRYQPIRVVDRNGEALGSLAHPSAANSTALGLGPAAQQPVDGQLAAAVVSAQDPDFWDNRGYHWPEVVRAILTNDAGSRPTITEQLVDQTLLPLPTTLDSGRRRSLQRALLAERLTQRYDKQQILDWYLNAAEFGPFLSGFDAAALTYFDEHVNRLQLGQLAVLVSLPGQAQTVLASGAAVRRAQRESLEAMLAADAVTAEQARLARNQPLQLQADRVQASFDPLLAQVADYFDESNNDDLLRRGGLTVWTTLDRDLQQQASCALASQISRLSGDSAAAAVPTDSGGACTAAELLPPLRPGDADRAHGVVGGAISVLDPGSGEQLVWVQLGEINRAALPSGQMTYPFIYLTAFARGLAPGTMVLDLPSEFDPQVHDASDYHGPVRMRSAIVDGMKESAVRALELAGADNVRTTLRELGLQSAAAPDELALLDGSLLISIDELTAAYAVVANRGLRVGAGEDVPSVRLVSAVADRFGRQLQLEPVGQRPVLGEGLAYLLLDVLTQTSDEGQLVAAGDSLGIARPAGVVRSEATGGAWATGFTPQRAATVWLASEPAESPLTPQNGPQAVLSAVLRYASRQLPPSGWSQPAQIAQVQVCDPSGLLPTEYCPDTVTEVFLLGTEPTAFDNLYQPFRINRETGNLATLETGIESVEVQVFLIPPPQAAAWARAAGLPQPPTQYDALTQTGSDNEAVTIDTPASFSIVSGELSISGHARPADFSFYRLQYGAGLNPTRWTQIGVDHAQRVWGGFLERWDTGGLSGLYTLQLIVALDDGTIQTDSVAVTVDNDPPSVQVLRPQANQQITPEADGTWLLELAIEEQIGVEQVRVYVDGRLVVSAVGADSIWQMEPLSPGAHVLRVEADDLAGNTGSSEEILFSFSD